MLRKRSRPVSSNKQAIVSDHNNNNNNSNNNIATASAEKSHKPTSFFFNSPRIFKDFFLSKDNSSEQSTPKSTIMSPSSVLDTKPLFSVFPISPPPLCLENKIQSPQNLPSAKRPQHLWENPGIGLALIDHDHDDNEWDLELGHTKTTTMTKTCKDRRSKLVVFGSQLKIQIPSLPLPTPPQIPLFPPNSSPQSPMEFGIKTPKSNLLGQVFVNSHREKKSMSMEDMELSEDYTCVISHGPIPKKTHIFGNCIVESTAETSSKSLFSNGLKGRIETSFSSPRNTASEDFSFLSFCHHCNKKIGQGKDIYMYRGERAFCSQECRGQEMLFDGIES